MKQLIILFPLILIGSYAMVAQSTAWTPVPEEAWTALLAQHPDARDVAWSLTDREYLQARFLPSEGDRRIRHAVFTPSGDWVETRIRLEEADLPDEVISARKAFYRGYTTPAAYQVSNRRYPVLYELHLTRRGAPPDTIRVNPQGYLVTHIPRQ